MLLLRCAAVLLVAALLGGASCAPMHSDRPLGSQAYAGAQGAGIRSASDLNGLWELDNPATAKEGAAPMRYLAWFQPELDRFVVLPADRRRNATVGELALLTHRAAGEEWFFFNEEDRRFAGVFQWALARQANVDTFLIWTTEPGRDEFQALVERGELPGTVVQDIRGKSHSERAEANQGWSANGLPVDHSVLLEGLEPRHLNFIVARRADLFQMDAPLVLRRVDTFPALKHPDVRAIRTPPAPPAAPVAVSAP